MENSLSIMQSIKLRPVNSLYDKAASIVNQSQEKSFQLLNVRIKERQTENIRLYQNGMVKKMKNKRLKYKYIKHLNVYSRKKRTIKILNINRKTEI